MLGALVLPLAMAWYRRRKATAGGFGDPDRRRGGKSEVDTRVAAHGARSAERAHRWPRTPGRFAGRRLSELEDEQLLDLYRESGSDADTRRLLEAYLDRRLGSAWRGQQERPHRRRTGMSREEALEILGLPPAGDGGRDQGGASAADGAAPSRQGRIDLFGG